MSLKTTTKFSLISRFQITVVTEITFQIDFHFLVKFFEDEWRGSTIMIDEFVDQMPGNLISRKLKCADDFLT